MAEFLSSLALAVFIATCMYALLYATLTIIGQYYEPFCRAYLALYVEGEYKHYMAALKQKEIPIYPLRMVCQYGIHEPKDMYYIIMFDNGDSPLYYNEKIVVSSCFRPVVKNLREKNGKEVKYEQRQE